MEEIEQLLMVEEGTKPYDLRQRAKEFAYECFDLCEGLPKTAAGNHIRGQLFRASSSVGANYRAASIAKTKKSFVSKISIVIEEVDESEYWLGFIVDKKIFKGILVNHSKAVILFDESKQLNAIFRKIRITAKENMKNEKLEKLNKKINRN